MAFLLRSLRFSGKQRLRRAGLVLALVVGLSVGGARPASSCSCCGCCPVGTSPVLSGVIAVAIAATSAFTGSLTTLLEAKASALASIMGAISGSETISDELKTRLHEKKALNQLKSAVTGVTAAQIAKYAPPDPQNQQLCNVIVTRQAQIPFRDWTEALATALAKEFEERYYEISGTGPFHTARILAGMVKTKTCDPLDIPPEMAECVNMSEPERWGANATADMYMPSPGKVYDLPVFKEKDDGGRKVFEPDLEDALKPGREGRLSFLIALEAVANTVGPRPQRPVGAQMIRQSSGVRQADVCQSAESAYIRPLVYSIAAMTRPDCEDPKFEKLCEVANMACQAARASGLTLDESYLSCFVDETDSANKGKGATFLQLQELSARVCSSERHQANAIDAGRKQAQELASMLLCEKGQMAVKSFRQQMETNIRRAVQGLHATRACWSGVERSPKVQTQ